MKNCTVCPQFNNGCGYSEIPVEHRGIFCPLLQKYAAANVQSAKTVDLKTDLDGFLNQRLN